MKRVWLITGLLSIGLFIKHSIWTDSSSTTRNRERMPEYSTFDAKDGGCYSFVPGSNGIQVIEVRNDGSKCGWIELQQLPASDSTSGIGWSKGYVKLVNTANPQAEFYLGSLLPIRQWNFSGKKQIACYVCTGGTNCDPNNPSKKKECLRNGNPSGTINCSKQVDCSKVIKVTQCFKKQSNDQLSPQWYSNDLQLCDAFPQNLANYSLGGGSYWQQTNVTK